MYNVPLGGSLLAAEVMLGTVTLPAILPALHLKISTAPPTTSDGIKLLGAQFEKIDVTNEMGSAIL